MSVSCEKRLRVQFIGSGARNPDVVARKQQRRRPDCASAQSGLRIRCLQSDLRIFFLISANLATCKVSVI